MEERRASAYTIFRCVNMLKQARWGSNRSLQSLTSISLSTSDFDFYPHFSINPDFPLYYVYPQNSKKTSSIVWYTYPRSIFYLSVAFTSHSQDIIRRASQESMQNRKRFHQKLPNSTRWCAAPFRECVTTPNLLWHITLRACLSLSPSSIILNPRSLGGSRHNLWSNQ